MLTSEESKMAEEKKTGRIVRIILAGVFHKPRIPKPLYENAKHVSLLG
jgi:hypothetical protein